MQIPTLKKSRRKACRRFGHSVLHRQQQQQQQQKRGQGHRRRQQQHQQHQQHRQGQPFCCRLLCCWITCASLPRRIHFDIGIGSHALRPDSFQVLGNGHGDRRPHWGLENLEAQFGMLGSKRLIGGTRVDAYVRIGAFYFLALSYITLHAIAMP